MTIKKLTALSEEYHAENIRKSSEPLPGLYVVQREEVTQIESMVYDPVLCIILRGRKNVNIGAQSVSLSQGDALLVSHDLPITASITQASHDTPYLSLIMALDLGTIRSLYEQVGEAVSEAPRARSLSASLVQPSWAEPLSRYVALMGKPLEAQVLGPLIMREIHFQLLMSPIGGMLRNLLSVDSHASRIAKAIVNIRQSFRQPMVVAELAQLAGMSPSSFHEHFKSVTGTSPLQFQKELRMIEARSLVYGGGRAISEIGYEVGYESPAHFSRDYSRKFGRSPKNDVARMG